MSTDQLQESLVDYTLIITNIPIVIKVSALKIMKEFTIEMRSSHSH
jgi:hypothetical protein